MEVWSHPISKGCVCVYCGTGQGVRVKQHWIQESRISQSVRDGKMGKHNWVYEHVISIRVHIKVWKWRVTEYKGDRKRNGVTEKHDGGGGGMEMSQGTQSLCNSNRLQKLVHSHDYPIAMQN